MGTTPSILYKYIRAEYALSFLNTLRLKLTPPIEFDDPFEFLMQVDGQLDRRRVAKHLGNREDQRQVFEEARRRGIFTGTFKAFKQDIRARLGTHVNDAINAAQPLIGDVLKKGFLVEVSKQYGVLCLTEDPTNILMWSHYASGHRGVAIGIEIPNWWKMHRVAYTGQRVLVDLQLLRNDAAMFQCLQSLMKTKSQHWAYEKEWRGLSLLENLDKIPNGETFNYFARLRPDLVKEIICGLRFPKQDLASVLSIQQQSLPTAKLKQAFLHDKTYEVILKDV